METPGPNSPNDSLLLLQDRDQNTIESRRRILRRFYEPLLLLEALKRVSPTSSRPDADEPMSSSTTGLRRAFVDGIAYLCAYERFSDSVTAAALAKMPHGLVLWLATNGGVGRPTIAFLEAMLQDLHHIAAQKTPVDRETKAAQIAPSLLRQAVTFAASRLQKYVNNIKNIELQQCIQMMRDSPGEGAETISRILELCNWLEKTFLTVEDVVHQPQDLLRLVLECYSQRKTLFFEPLQLFSGQGGQRASDFARLFLLLCKLGKHVTITRKVVEATVHLCDDFCEPIFVETVPSSPERTFPLLAKEGTVESILGRTFSSRVESDRFKVRLQSLWNADEIGAVLSKERPSKTKVHAELLLAHHFHRKNLQFLDGHDRYIGCSKPTCYLCDAYLRNHPAAFAIPRSHQKIYLAWRCPDVPEGCLDTYRLHQEQETMWLELIESVRKDLKKEVESRAPRAAIPPDSTAGVTSENHPTFSSFNLSKVLSMLRVEDDALSNNAKLESDCESDDEDGGVRLI